LAKPKKAHLTEGPVAKTLRDLTIPMMFGLVGIVSFNLVDTFFVARLGTTELAALSFTFPVVMIIGSFTLGLGVGVSAVISRAIGEGNHHKVQELTTDSLILAVILGIMFVITGFLTIEPVFRLLGASQTLLPLIKEYMVVWYAGIIFIVIPMIGNNAIRATGDMKTPASIMLMSVVLNMVLDPLFIFGLGPFPRCGLWGAAIATVIARSITLIFAMYVLAFRDDMLTFIARPVRKILDSWKLVLYLGVPTAGTRLIMPLATAIIIRLVSSYGPEAVAGFGVASRVEFFALTVIVALATVLGPFVGQNWGAGMNGRVLSGIGLCKLFSLGWGIIMLIFLAVLARPIAHIFNANPVVISTIVMYLRIVPVGYGLFGILIISAMTLTVLHKPLYATALMIVQVFVLYLPFAFLGAYFFGLAGIFGALAAAYIIAGILANFVLGRVLRKRLT